MNYDNMSPEEKVRLAEQRIREHYERLAFFSTIRPPMTMDLPLRVQIGHAVITPNLDADPDDKNALLFKVSIRGQKDVAELDASGMPEAMTIAFLMCCGQNLEAFRHMTPVDRAAMSSNKAYN